MEVLKDEQERLDAALGQQQALYGIERPLPALPRVARVPLGVVNSDLEEREEGGEGRPKGAIQRHELAHDLLADLALVVAIADLEIRLEQVDHREIWRRPSVRHGAPLEHEPAGPVPVCELEEEPRFSNARLADDCDQLSMALRGLLKGAGEPLELVITANETTQRARSQG